jgi:hypothetical protein
MIPWQVPLWNRKDEIMRISRELGPAALLALMFFGLQAMSVKAQGSPPSTGSTASSVSAPIAVESSSFKGMMGKISPRTWLVLRFRNTASIAADEVRFVVRYDKSEHVIVDKGLFSPGIPIDHWFTVQRTPTFRDTPESTVRYVHFTDGTHYGDPI